MSRILIVDEQPVTRQALRLMMEAERHEVVAEASNGIDALHQARLCQPDLMILELSIPRLGGLEVIQRLSAQGSPVKVLVLTSQDSEYFAGRCLKAGAAGFVSKQEDPQAIKQAVKAIIQGNSYFPSHALGSVSAAEDAGQGASLEGLSVRELTVLQMLARGLSNIAIADQLSLSDKTVSTYKVRLMQKLHAKSLVELVDIGRRHGLVEGRGTPEQVAESAPLTEAQQQELALLRKVIDAVPHPISIRGLDGRILFCNQSGLRLFNLSENEMVGHTLAELGMFADQTEAEVLRSALVEAIGKGQPYDVDIEFKSLRSGRKVGRHWGRPLQDGQGQLVGAICGTMDMTERDTLLRQLRSANARLESLSQGKTAFLNGMSTELQGPLQNIMAMIDLAMNQEDPGRRREPLEVARMAAGGLMRLLDDLLLLNRLESGQLSISPEVVDLRRGVEQQVRLFREQAAPKGVTVDMDLSRVLQPWVWADPLRWRQLLANLLSNAVKFTDEGQVMVRLDTRGRGAGKVEVMLEVLDSGIGIAAADQTALFEPFTQLLDSERIRRGGTGLGLPLCKGLVEQMGGEISLHSTPGAGTRVTIRLRLTAAEAPPEATPAQ